MRWDFFRRSEPDDPAARTGSAARDERLSDYLEGVLPATDRRLLDEELKRDEGLRTMLEGMALVRDGMHELGMMRSPRSFTITASRRPRSSALPRLELGMRIATAAASVALVAAFIGPGFLGSSSSDEAAGGQPVTVEARASKDGESGVAATGTVESFAASAPAPTDVAVQPSGVAGGATGGGTESGPATGAAAAPEAPPAASPESATGLAQGGEAGAALAAPTAEETTAPAASGTPAADAAVPSSPAADARSAAPGPAETSTEIAAAAASGDEQGASSSESSGFDLVTWSRVGAGVAALALGVGSLALWWRRRSYGRFGM